MARPRHAHVALSRGALQRPHCAVPAAFRRQTCAENRKPIAAAGLTCIALERPRSLAPCPRVCCCFGAQPVCADRPRCAARARAASAPSMGNSYGVPWFARGVGEAEADAIFDALDRDKNGFLTLKELMSGGDWPGSMMMPHSLPALYFFDKERTGTLTRAEFGALLQFCEAEKGAVERSLSHDREFRSLIQRASVAGVKDASMLGRNRFRRFSSYANVQSIFRKDNPMECRPVADPPGTPDHPPDAAEESDDIAVSSVSRPSVDSPDPPMALNSKPPPHTPSSPSHSAASDTDESNVRVSTDSRGASTRGCRMFSSQREFKEDCMLYLRQPEDQADGALAPLDAQSRTAVDAAVLENIMRANITKLAELLENETQRVEFMEWLWKLTDFNKQGVVTLEELRIFLAALEEDGISLEELAFYKEGDVPLEESIVNEFDTTHTGLLTRDEFLVLADLVTREYEFWQNRHLDRVGDYELGRTIGRGSSGIVRIGIHVTSRAKVAIKIIKKGNVSEQSRLDREISSLSMAAQKNIVDLLEVLDSDENVFIVMELCGGGSLEDIVLLYPDERIPENIARNYLRQLFEALAFLHRNGICHRDIRLDNLMLDNKGVLKITDFGHSGVYHAGWDIFETTLVGSVYNLSPEQIEGRLYSGEKIDVWSGGIVAYCMLVGRPPFVDADVNIFLRSIQTCTFDVPDFLSPEAADLVRCMIRVKAEDRIPYEQMLHHPWFYSGPESRPVMDTVVIPVDAFFKKRPDLAEMIMAGTIHEHNVHFHLADTANPNSFPGVLRGQAWALKCMSLDMNIKFTVSLFTTEPSQCQQLQQVMSCSKLMNAMQNINGRSSSPAALPVGTGSVSLPRSPTNVPAGAQSASERGEPPEPEDLALPRSLQNSPTPSAVDPETDTGMQKVELPATGKMSISASVSEGELGAYHEPTEACVAKDCRVRGISGRRSRGRSKSLDFSGEWMLRISRSVTVDAFPYQKVLPPREMPQQARELNFDRPDGKVAGLAEEMQSSADSRGGEQPGASIEYRGMSRSRTLEDLNSEDDVKSRLRAGNGLRQGNGNRSVRRIIHHPAPAARRARPPAPASNVEEAASEGDTAATGAMHRQLSVPRTAKRSAKATANAPVPEFMPYIEVKLLDGESGLFLRICRKLKMICDTKLANAAERQKRRVVGRRSLAVLRRTASQRGGIPPQYAGTPAPEMIPE